ncbi:MAG: ABC transporter permease [Microthrixaceae bacterium]|nr:ABC transporter permease [Microthrixaceae bacterium]
MEKFLIFTVVGLTLSATYAVIASGLVLTYATTGIFNFSQGAIGMVAAFAYWQLRFDWGWPTPIALVVSLGLLAPAIGLAIDRGIMRGLRGTSEATRLVVSISLMVALIALANLVWEPGRSRPMSTFFEGSRVDLGITTITYHQAITIVVAVLIAAGLRFLLHNTRIGVSMRANVDDDALVLLNGAQPKRIAGISWAVGGFLAGVGGILIAPTLSLEAGSLSLLIINAYAAAIFGRLRSLPLTFVGAIVIGLTEGYLAGYLPGDNQYFAAFRPAATVVILFVALLLVPNPRLRSRAHLREYFPPPSRSGMVMLAVVVVVAGVVLATTLDTVSLITYGPVFSLGIVALSLVPLVGFAGQISLAQLSFAGIGALAVAHHGHDGSPLGLVLAVVLAAAVGTVVALPVMRLTGIYLALATAAFAVALDRWLFNLPDFSVGPVHVRLFGLGSVSVDPLRILGHEFDSPAALLMLSAVVFAAVSLLVAALRWSRFGRQLVAMRDSEAACATFGLNLMWPRVGVFALSAGIAGLGGALYAMQLGSVAPARFDLLNGLPIFILVVVGGAGLVGSALFAGGILYGVLPLTATLGPVIAKINSLFPGFTGVGLGRNPSGAVPVFSAAAGPLRNDPVVLASMGVAMAVCYVLRLAEVFGNWAFVVLLGVALVAAMVVARRRSSSGAQGPGQGAGAGPDPEDLEWVGVTEPFTPAHLARMEQVLDLQSVDLEGAELDPVGGRDA